MRLMDIDHYFSTEPASVADITSRALTIAGTIYHVDLAKGVFSSDGLDRGTAVLLRDQSLDDVTADTPRHYLDIGCGWGPISLALAERAHPESTIWAIDVNQRARQLATANAEKAGFSNIRVCSADDIPSDMAFDQIWSNPPIRIGKTALHELLLQWLPRLRRGGVCYLVVAKKLGSDSLITWLQTHLDPESPESYLVSRHSSDKGFRIIKVERQHDASLNPAQSQQR